MIMRPLRWITGLLPARSWRRVRNPSQRSSPEDTTTRLLWLIIGLLLAKAVLVPDAITPLLWVTGLLSAAVMLIPYLLTFGLMLVFPGLVLAAMPTAFVYLSTFALIRLLLRWIFPWIPGLATDVGALALTITLGVAVTVPSRRRGGLASQDALSEDVTPGTPIRLSGHVLLEKPAAMRLTAAGELVGECDALSAALLQTPGVEAVTIAGSTSTGQTLLPVTYRLVGTSDALTPGVAPHDPGGIVEHFPEPEGSSPEANRGPAPVEWLKVVAARRRAIAAAWALRLAEEERLVAEPAGGDPDYRITITTAGPRGGQRISVQGLSIADRAGRVLLRNQRVVARPLVVPFTFLPEDGKRELEVRIGVGRTRIQHAGPGYREPVETLYTHTNLARPEGRQDGVAEMRERLAVALQDRSRPASDRTFELAGAWLDLLDSRRMEPRDLAVVAMMIADSRVPDLEKVLIFFDCAGPEVRMSLRDAITTRLSMRDSPAKTVSLLDARVSRMPPGIYAQPTAAERALVQDRGFRREAPGLVERVADQGAPGVPQLLEILVEDAAVEPWAKRQLVLAAVRRALTRLGPAAAPALSTVERLLVKGRLAGTWEDALAWWVALVRMGRPLDELPFPAHFDTERVERTRREIERELKRS